MKTSEAKVTIPREAADRIEGLRSSALSNERIVDVYVSEGRGTPPSTRGIRSISFDTLLSALVNGYERELTEEEAREQAFDSIRSYYAWLGERERCEGIRVNGNPFEFKRAQTAIRLTLNVLGTEISGINDAKLYEKGGAA
ncbi:hypothetical protein [Paenibacillus odorifer]|uniref:hypothetical protein n=1 Tax=Paenibacillus TaxID=44249 RepID=UPI00096CAC90|nr:hypothetical protein [Paenibacillus odorifer]OMD02558.1 hypothetical protein BJP46_15765 [Paenibacillus odorifer]